LKRFTKLATYLREEHFQSVFSLTVVLIMVGSIVGTIEPLMHKESTPLFQSWGSFVMVGCISLGVTMFLVVMLINKRPSFAVDTLSYAGVPFFITMRARLAGCDINKVAKYWKSVHPDSGVNGWFRFMRGSTLRRKVAVGVRIARVASSISRSHFAAMLIALDVPDDDIKSYDNQEMLRLFEQGVPPSSLGFVVGNDIDYQTFLSFRKGNGFAGNELLLIRDSVVLSHA